MTDNKVQWNGLRVKWKTRKASHPDPKLDIDVLCGLVSMVFSMGAGDWGMLNLRAFQG